MQCSSFRSALQQGMNNPEMLAHLRACDSCLEQAVRVDADHLFRSLGGELEPPQGVETFVHEVMQEVHLRQTERGLSRHTRFSPVTRWAAAAALALAVLAITITTRTSSREPVTPGQIARTAAAPVIPANLPAVDSYEEAGAIIVELPETRNDDMKVVMIFDPTLPVDL